MRSTSWAALAGILVAVLAAAPAAAIPPSFGGGTTPDLPAPPRFGSRLQPALVGTASPSVGTLKILVIPIAYSDVAPSADRTDEAAYFRDMLFGNDAIGAGPYPFVSMAQFYERQSRGQLAIEGDVVDWVTAPRTREYYATKSSSGQDGCNGLGTSTGNFTLTTLQNGGARELVRDALMRATDTVDLDDYDLNGDGILDGVIVLHPGPGGEMTDACLDLWSHQYEDEFEIDGEDVRVRYLVAPERLESPLDGRDYPSGIGVIAHEFGHILGLPDLYALANDGFGTGQYSLMSYGLLALDGVEETAFGPDIAPTAFGPFEVEELSWGEPDVVTENQCDYELQAFSDVPNPAEFVRINLNDASQEEYYYLAYEQAADDWLAYGADALTIWHVDDAKRSDLQAINRDSCAPLSSRTECKDDHYWVSFEQRDGRYDLELGANRGDLDDLWQFGGTQNLFDPEGSLGGPSSCSWDGVDCSVTVRVKSLLGDRAKLAIIVDPESLPDEPRILRTPESTSLVLGQSFDYDPGLLTGSEVTWFLDAAPEGMTIDAATGAVSWTPERPGAYDVQIAAENCAGRTTLSFSLVVHQSSGGGGGCSVRAGLPPAHAWPWGTLLLAGMLWRLAPQRRRRR